MSDAPATHEPSRPPTTSGAARHLAAALPFSKLRSHLAALFVFWVAVLGGLGWVTAARLQSLSGTLESVYRDRVVCQVQLRAVGDAFERHIAGAVMAFQSGAIAGPAAQSRIAAARREATLNWQRYIATQLVEAERDLIAQAEPLLHSADDSAGEAQRLVAAGDLPGLREWSAHRMPASFAPLGTTVDQLFALQTKAAGAEIEQARSSNRQAILGMLLLIAAGLVLGGLAAWALLSHYTAMAQDNDRALRRLNRFYTALSRTNHLIARARNAGDLLQELCRICSQAGHAGMTAVFLRDGPTATRVAAAGPAADFFRSQPADWDIDDPAYRMSPTAIALWSGERRIGHLTPPEDGAPPWRWRVEEHGIRSIGAFPLLRGGEVHGALTLYATETDFFDEDVLALLSELAGDVSFALDNFDREAARLRMQQETQLGLERFQKLFQSSPVACVITSLAEIRVMEINDVMCARYGVTRSEIIGTRREKLGSILVEPDAAEYRNRLKRDGRVRNMEAQTMLPDGGTAAVIVNAETIEYQGQACVMAMVLDVTELRAAEAAQQARSTAEAANRAKTAFLSQMSHELRNPLNAMLGFTQLVQNDARTRLLPRDIDQLEHIRQAGWHLLALINDVMDVSRIESGQFEIRLAPVPLHNLLTQVATLSEAAARTVGVSIEVDPVDAAHIGVLADPVRLRQVFINLMSNAVKYNRPGGAVRVTLQAAGSRVLVQVADTGLGMTEEQLAHLYEPFNRLGREEAGIEGTGLGLALTRQLVTLMGGELAIESRMSEGTTARVFLPAAELTGDAADPASIASATEDGVAEPSGTVLYIEDNVVNVMVIEQMLSRWAGVRFVHAADGATGIAQAAELRPDLVLMDMQLPDMDGIEILRRLRMSDETAGLRVIALSASSMPTDVEHALAQGAADYWTKPVELHGFLQGMSRHLAGRGRHPPGLAVAIPAT